jgi:hypothetical protein
MIPIPRLGDDAVVEVRTHYATTDPEFMSDHCGIDIYINNNLFTGFDEGSFGRGQAEGYLQAIRTFFPLWPVRFTQVADIEI